MVIKTKISTIELKRITENLKKFSENELCEISYVLNGWEWDNRLGEKPKNFDKLPWFRRFPYLRRSREDYISPIRILIERRVGSYTLLKYHWKNHLHMTDEEIEKETLNRLFSSEINNQ